MASCATSMGIVKGSDRLAGEVETNNRWIGAKRGGEGGGAVEQGGELLQAEPGLRWLQGSADLTAGSHR